MVHTPVLLEESIEALRIRRKGKYVDCTVGTGGHAEAILEKEGQLLGIDADPEALKIAEERLKRYKGNFILVHDNFRYLRDICYRFNFQQVDGILFDLGLSSLQLEDKERGFSFQLDSPLDMRFDPNQELTAADVVNTLPKEQIAEILRQYGEERRSQQIAQHIINNRPLRSTKQLSQVVTQAVRKRRRIHPATKTFQALRITVNKELENLELALKQAVDILYPGGRLVVISFHSVEDRVVKQFLRDSPGLKLIAKKIIRPSPAEIQFNPRSRSAKMRVAECIAPYRVGRRILL